MSPTPGDTPALAGHTIDWNAALAQHQRWLRTVIYSRIPEPDGVEEVYQETALAAVAQKAPLQDASKVAPWLYRLAVLQSLLYRRRRGRARKLQHRFVERVRPNEEASSPDPLDWLLQEERRKLVRQVLKELPRRDAEILMLKYTEGWSYRQLAGHLGISESAVEARLHRARERMRTALAAQEAVGVSKQ